VAGEGSGEISKYRAACTETRIQLADRRDLPFLELFHAQNKPSRAHPRAITQSAFFQHDAAPVPWNDQGRANAATSMLAGPSIRLRRASAKILAEGDGAL